MIFTKHEAEKYIDGGFIGFYFRKEISNLPKIIAFKDNGYTYVYALAHYSVDFYGVELKSDDAFIYVPIKSDEPKVLLNEVLPVEFNPIEGVDIGEYDEVGGHHIHAKAAFKGDISYNPGMGFAVSQDFMESMGWSHPDMTAMQRKLFKELYDSGRENTLAEQPSIALKALKAGGATEKEASSLVKLSLLNLKEQGVTAPTRIPWYSK